MNYDHLTVESKWQAKWTDLKVDVCNLENSVRKYYNLMMFPYPSAEGLHVGNMYAFTAADVHGRYKRFQGFNVFEPIGLDGFGIHSENFALKIGRHPVEHAKITEKNFYAQLRKIGCMFDWTKTVETYNPDYYRWTQWLFVQMFKHGLAYRKASNVNWCPKCKTVLADEQVIAGACERCTTLTEKKNLEQWFFRITQYAEELLRGHAEINWAEKVITAQEKWIGKSEGLEIDFTLSEMPTKLTVFTTRPDTLNLVSFIALAPDHPLVPKIIDVNSEPYKELIASIKNKDKIKLGLETTLKVSHPLTGKLIPVWLCNYVSIDYGTGAIMGVPGYDERDLEFATKYHLDILEGEPDASLKEKLIQQKLGKPKNNYHLRDWLISRQRYWGPPIPMIYCKACDWQPVPEDDLPVLLPNIADFQPDGKGKGPLANHPEFYEAKCPKCGGQGTRETDVSDTFLDSAWYFLRYPSVRSGRSDQLPFDPEITKAWLPVDMYTGGAEHAVLHLMYARFIGIALHAWGYLNQPEQISNFFAHGLIIKDGAKMSKSKGNVVNPDDYVAKYGADALRLYLMFMGPVSEGGDFRDTGMEGMAKWLKKVYSTITDQLAQGTEDDLEATVALTDLVLKATQGMEKRRYNTVIAWLMEFFNLISKMGYKLSRESWKKVVILFASFAPHVAEELYQALGGGKPSIHFEVWPKVDQPSLTQKDILIVVQHNGKVRDRLTLSYDNAQDEQTVKHSALKSAKLLAQLKEAKYRTIFIPGKVINFIDES